MRKDGSRSQPPHDWRDFDARERPALTAALAFVGAECTSLTVYMCWHGGAGHDYPATVVEAARRLRERHALGGRSDDNYTSVTFAPSDEDLADFIDVAPYSDLAYAGDAKGELLLEVSGEGASGGVRGRPDGRAISRCREPMANSYSRGIDGRSVSPPAASRQPPAASRQPPAAI